VAPYLTMCSVAEAPASIADLAGQLRNHKSLLARAGGIPLGCYEGGFADCNHSAIASDPASYGMMTRWLDTLNVYLGGVYNNYNHSGSRWGAKAFIGQSSADAPIYRALADWNTAHPRSVVSVAPAAPSSGRVVAASRPSASTQVFGLDGRRLPAVTTENPKSASMIQVGSDGSVRVTQDGRAMAPRGRPDRAWRPERQ
jgi:hypothetical protein